MRQIISDEYLKMQHEFHRTRPDYGISGTKYVNHVRAICDRLQSRNVLDWGCGKGYLQKGIPWPITQYDRCIPEHATPPEPHDIVVCTDTLEHIEPEFLDNVLDELRDLTKAVLFCDIALRPAVKFLPDGRNAHLIQEPPNFWLERLMKRFEVQDVHVKSGEMIFVGFPLKGQE